MPGPLFSFLYSFLVHITYNVQLAMPGLVIYACYQGPCLHDAREGSRVNELEFYFF